MDANYAAYKRFTIDEAEKWGRENYLNWLPKLQNRNYTPQTPIEKFFRYYTQGASSFFNNIARFDDFDTYDFKDSFFNKKMFNDSVYEINHHPIPNDIVVYRYIPKHLIKYMLEWGKSKHLKRNSILSDKGFFSTTLSKEAVQYRPYTNLKERILFTIFVPKGIPAVYVDLISDMHEQEMLFAPRITLKVINNHIFSKCIECIVC